MQNTKRRTAVVTGSTKGIGRAIALRLAQEHYNINKWAQGIGDTLVTSILCEAIGRGTPPVIAVPCLKMDLVRHPAFKKNIALLHECGVRVLHDPERYPSPLMVPWDEVFKTLCDMTGNKSTCT